MDSKSINSVLGEFGDMYMDIDQQTEEIPRFFFHTGLHKKSWMEVNGSENYENLGIFWTIQVLGNLLTKELISGVKTHEEVIESMANGFNTVYNTANIRAITEIREPDIRYHDKNNCIKTRS